MRANVMVSQGVPLIITAQIRIGIERQLVGNTLGSGLINCFSKAEECREGSKKQIHQFGPPGNCNG
jgi:hypothetical protein